MTQLVDPYLARQFDRLPPHSYEAEMCLLASMMLDKDVATRAMQVVDRDDFFQADHQLIFDVLARRYRAGQPVDALLLREELVRRQLLEEVGGNAYLGQILDSVPSAAHGEHYAKVIRGKAVLRRIIAQSNDALRDCYAPLDGLTEAEVARKHADALSMIAATGTTDTFRRLGDVVSDVIDAKMRNEVRRVPTAIGSLDAVIGGLPLGGFVLIGGRPGSGKSQLGKQVLKNVAETFGPVGLVTVEESEEKVAENMLSNAAGVENNRIAYNRLEAGHWSELIRVTPDLERLDFWVDDAPVRLGEVESAVTTAAVKHGCRLVMVDYLQLIDPDTAGENENREITKISKTLKACAKRLDIALVAMCQLNRGNETGSIRKPALRDLRGSGSLEQDGDVIVLLHREDYYHYQEQGYVPTHQLEAIVAKNKYGCLGVVPLHFSGKYQRVREWEIAAGVTDPF